MAQKGLLCPQLNDDAVIKLLFGRDSVPNTCNKTVGHNHEVQCQRKKV